jgi:hemerythrin
MQYSSYKIGILEIDIQHFNIDYLLAELAKEGLEKEANEEKFELLRNALVHHFDFEEKWSQTNNKNFDTDHLKSHKKLLEKLKELHCQFTKNETNMCEISLAMKMELLKHVQNHDMRLEE